ncbi:MAG: TIR domain-containing protein [Bacteroidetes bacterium]|nr:TIR domain-containing protein [Bacteroidota bacterium]
MSKSIFISHVHEDNEKITLLEKWAQEKRLGDIVITKETEDKRHEGKEAIKQYISDKIRGAMAVLVLIGQDTHNHGWIEAEVELAHSFHKKVICIRLHQTTGGIPPILANKPIVPFEPNAIKQAIFN